MKTVKIAPRTLEVLKQHNISVGIYNQFGKCEKIAFSTQLRRWGRVSSPHLVKKLVWARLTEAAQ
jgi:hypothetical protein